MATVRIDVTFTEQRLRVQLNLQQVQGSVQVDRVEAQSAAHGRVAAGATLVAVNGDRMGPLLGRQAWVAFCERVKNTPRPMTLTFEQPAPAGTVAVPPAWDGRVPPAVAPAPAPAPAAEEAPALVCAPRKAPEAKKAKRRRTVADESDDGDEVPLSQIQAAQPAKPEAKPKAKPPRSAAVSAAALAAAAKGPTYKGVTEPRPGRFKAMIYDQGQHGLGSFPSALAAARAYDREARLRGKEPNRRDVCDHCERPTVDSDGDALADVLICEECEAEAHLGCANLGAVPADDWRCAQCIALAPSAAKLAATPRSAAPPADTLRAPSPRAPPASAGFKSAAPPGAESSDDDDINALRAKAAKPSKKKRADPLAELLADEKKPRKRKKQQSTTKRSDGGRLHSASGDRTAPAFEDVGGMALGRATDRYASLGGVRSAFAGGWYGAQNGEFLRRFDAWLRHEAAPAALNAFTQSAHAAVEAWRRGRDFLLARDLLSDDAASDLRRVAALGNDAAGAEFLLAFAHFNAGGASFAAGGSS